MSHFSENRPVARQAYARKFAATPIAVMLLSGLLSSSCGGPTDDMQENSTPKQAAALRLHILHPDKTNIRESVTGTGTIGAAQTSNIGVVTPGIVESIFVKVGDRVKKGQSLFQTRQNDYQISKQLAQAELAAAEARHEQARLDFDRAVDLLEKKFISQAQHDTTANSLKAAKAEADVAQARLAQAAQRLIDTTVRAPYDGVVTGRNVDEGTYKSAQTFSADGSVLQLQQIDTVVALIRIPEIYLSRFNIGTPGDIFIDGIEGIFHADIYAINDKVDRQSRTVEVRFALPNEDHRIKAGLFVRVDIHPPERVALLLEQIAIVDRSGTPHVFLLDGGAAKKQPVVLREYDPTTVEIVSGLSDSDLVLAGPDVLRLADGDLIPGMNDANR